MGNEGGGVRICKQHEGKRWGEELLTENKEYHSVDSASGCALEIAEELVNALPDVVGV